MLAYLENRLEMHESDLIDFLIRGDNPDNIQDYTLIGPSRTVLHYISEILLLKQYEV